MTSLKKYFSKNLTYMHDTLDGGECELSPLHFLSDKNARRLSGLYGKVHLGLVVLEIRDFYFLSSGHGQHLGLQLVDLLEYEAVRVIPQFYHQGKVLFSTHVDFSTILIFFEITEDFTSFANATHLFRLQVGERVNLNLSQSGTKNIEILAGYSHIESWRREDFEQVLFRAYCQARRIAVQPKECDSLPLHDEFQWLLEGQRVAMLYQAVINFDNGEVMGWEAFMRGPTGSFFHLPEMLFKYAEESGEALRLDRLCRSLALQRLKAFDDNQYLFINVHPASLSDPNFTPEAVALELDANGLLPRNVVLEFTERHRVHDMNHYAKIFDAFRAVGFRIALDDVGTGQYSLRTISQLRPNYLKLDVSLIGSIDANPYNRVMVETLAYLAERIGARLIAVGIETETELSSLVSMGIFGGQGLILAPPSEHKATEPVSLPLRASFTNESIQTLKCSVPIKELARPTIAVPARTTVKAVKDLLADKPPQTSVVVLQGKRPVGLLMQYSMDRHLSTQFGMSLYYHRDVARIMDCSPLIVEGSQAMEDVARKAMERESTKIYDDIVITEHNEFLGVVSVQRMLDNLAQTQVELAKGANPLTGLPGNVSIEKELEARSRDHIPTSLIYVDLDNFKVYNDVFGFERGDRIILFAAQVLVEAAKGHGSPGDFVAHVGGDDFLLLAAPETAQAICEAAMNAFAAGTPSLYRKDDVERGYIIGKGRDGKTAKFPLTTLSIAMLDCDFAPPFNMEHLSNRVAEVKKAAKAIAGNSCVRENYHDDANPNTPLPAEPSRQQGAEV